MRITFVLPTVNMSGGIKVAAIHAQALSRMGHDVLLISPPARQPGIRERLRALRRGRVSWRAPAMASPLDNTGLAHVTLERWRPVGDADVPDADAVVATWWETAEWVGALDARKGAKVYFVQGHEVFPHLPIERCTATYRLPMHKIVVAQWLQKLMAERYEDTEVDIVPNSVDRKLFHAAPRGRQPAPTAGFLYSSAPIKGFDVLCESITLLRKSVPDLKLLSFGAEAATRTLPANTKYVQLPGSAQIRDLYAQCDVWVGASRSEGFNLTALESMACRTPVVATRTGWPAESVRDAWNGYLAEIDDSAALAAGVQAVLSLPDEEWRRMSSNAFATASNGSWEHSSLAFEAALQRAVRRARSGEIAGRPS